jgi:uncharacterized protein YkwD
VVVLVLAATPAGPAASVPAVEQQVVGCANLARAAKGLPALKLDPVLGSAAHRFAKDMARRGFFDHTDPEGRDPGDRIGAREHGDVSWGENIAQGYPDAASVCRGWLHSSDHRANILDRRYTRIGGGFARGGDGPYWVQEFATQAGD